jgi:hypothetical protein
MVLMMCLTTKKTFEVEDPEVIVLKNGRYAFRAPCPWKHDSGKLLYAFKFASKQAYEEFIAKNSGESEPESGDSERGE